jgi:hypothetical protein
MLGLRCAVISMDMQGTFRLGTVFSTSFNAFRRHAVAFIILGELGSTSNDSAAVTALRLRGTGSLNQTRQQAAFNELENKIPRYARAPSQARFRDIQVLSTVPTSFRT